MTVPLNSIIMYVAASLLGAIGQMLYKTGAESASGGWTSYVFNLHLLGGVLCYVAVMILFVAGMKSGGSIVVLYPIYATTFIWAALIAMWMDGTRLSGAQWAGMALIISGVALIGVGHDGA